MRGAMARCGGNVALTVQFLMNITRADDDIVVCVCGSYDPGRPAKTWGPPDNWEPEEGPEFQISSVLDEDGGSVELTEEEYNEACEIASSAYDEVVEDSIVDDAERDDDHYDDRRDSEDDYYSTWE